MVYDRIVSTRNGGEYDHLFRPQPPCHNIFSVRKTATYPPTDKSKSSCFPQPPCHCRTPPLSPPPPSPEFNSCGTSGYSCIDPGAPCDVDFRTWSPTFTPTSSPSSSIVWDDPSALDDVLTKSTETSYESSFSVGIIVFCILAVCGVVLLLGVFLKKRLKPVNSHTGVHDLESTLLHPAETGYVPNV